MPAPHRHPRTCSGDLYQCSAVKGPRNKSGDDNERDGRNDAIVIGHRLIPTTLKIDLRSPCWLDRAMTNEATESQSFRRLV
jgi:hypothetical protein